MFSRMICMPFLKDGRCNNPSCKLKHVKDIASLESASKAAHTKTSKPKTAVPKAAMPESWDRLFEAFTTPGGETKKVFVGDVPMKDETKSVATGGVVVDEFRSGVKVRP